MYHEEAEAGRGGAYDCQPPPKIFVERGWEIGEILTAPLLQG